MAGIDAALPEYSDCSESLPTFGKPLVRRAGPR
jgi:hypothetical protein